MPSVKCVAPVAMGLPALGRVVKPGEVVEVSDELAASLAADSGLWEVVGAATPPANTPPASAPPSTDDGDTEDKKGTKK